jgi:hypothetical protein
MRKFGNLETQHLYDKTHSGDMKMKDEQPKGDESEHGDHDHESVVAEHGKAHTLHMKHDHEAGAHHVHSHHEDGHVHKAKFGSAGEAHDHAAKMAGVEAGEEEAEASGGMEGSEDKGSKAAAFGIQ